MCNLQILFSPEVEVLAESVGPNSMRFNHLLCGNIILVLDILFYHDAGGCLHPLVVVRLVGHLEFAAVRQRCISWGLTDH